MTDYLEEIDGYHLPLAPGVDLSLEAIFQDPLELATLSYWVEQLGVKTCLEVGVASGGFMHYCINVLGLKVLGIDVVKPVMVDEGLVYIGDCHAPETIKWAEGNAPYDMVFIDADHSLPSVSRDWQLYNHMASKMVVIHDIAHSVLPGPRQLWNQIGGRKLEVVAPGKSLGIGILFVEGG